MTCPIKKVREVSQTKKKKNTTSYLYIQYILGKKLQEFQFQIQ